MTRATLAAIVFCSSVCATEPNEATRRWWSHVEALANDGIEGRDTGSEGYRRAARYVVTQFETAGLKPAGEQGYYQPVPLHSTSLRVDRSMAALVRQDGSRKLRWLHEITLAVQPGLPNQVVAGLVFAGSGTPPAGIDLRGKMVVRLGAPVGT